jgi:hypothetical protein
LQAWNTMPNCLATSHDRSFIHGERALTLVKRRG